MTKTGNLKTVPIQKQESLTENMSIAQPKKFLDDIQRLNFIIRPEKGKDVCTWRYI